jgi:peptidoglycan/LPS O-acetylase OafA/YrhL
VINAAKQKTISNGRLLPFMKPDSKRNLQLDVLRGVAILLVFGRHLEIPRPKGVLGVFADMWYHLGWIGVDLFFVLSGFLIAGLLMKELQKRGRIDVGRFLLRRGLKIYPAYFVFITYLTLMPAAKALLRGENVWTTVAEQWGQCWPNLVFLQNYLWSPAGHLWTLAVEEHFYLMLPFGIMALAGIGRVRLIVWLCVMAVPLFLALRCLSVWTEDSFSVTMSATHLRLDALLFGVGIQGLAQYSPECFAALRRWRLALVTAGVILWVPNLYGDLDPMIVRTVGLTGTLLGAGAFLVAAYHTHASDFGRWARFIAPPARLAAWMGVYSYAIYLWHVTTIGVVERELGGRVLSWVGGSPPTVWLACAGAASAGAVLVGVAASKMVEQPVLLLRDRLFPSHTVLVPAKTSRLGRGEERRGPDMEETRSSRSTALASDTLPPNKACLPTTLASSSVQGE